jgi:mannose-1-phosphate guanylyltransferase
VNHAIILAGGIGSRFWPLSTDTKPKQFLNLFSDKSLLTESLERLSSLIPRKHIYIATNKSYKEETRKHARRSGIPVGNCLFEPEARNTLAPIGLLSQVAFLKDKEAIVLVLPSDHFIKDRLEFLSIIKRAIEAAQQGYIVTLGIKPNRPETGYGYIKVKSKVKPCLPVRQAGLPAGSSNKAKVYEIERFIEKPDLQRANKLIKDKRYYWNGGIFIFKAGVLLGEIRKYSPLAYESITAIKTSGDLNKHWGRIPALSIDYAVMEKSKKLALVIADCGWADLGSWKTVEEVLKKDKLGNISKGKHVDFKSSNTTVWAQEKPVATLGLKNMVIVDTKSGLLVCSKEMVQKIKEIVTLLKQKGYTK